MSWLNEKPSRQEIETQSLAGVHSSYVGGGAVLCRVLNKFGMYVPGSDLSLAPHLILDGFWESWVTRRIAEFVQPGDRVIDVGACFGYFTLLLAELVGPTGRVLALEPAFPTRAFLEKNVEINGFSDWCQTVTVAAGDRKKSDIIRFPQAHWGSARIGGDPLLPGKRDTAREAPVAVEPLDTLWADTFRGQDAPLPRFAKIDAEGSELAIWDGMRALWRENPEMVVCMEYAAALGGHELVERLRKDNAKVEMIDASGDLVPFENPSPMEMLWVTRS